MVDMPDIRTVIGVIAVVAVMCIMLVGLSSMGEWYGFVDNGITLKKLLFRACRFRNLDSSVQMM